MARYGNYEPDHKGIEMFLHSEQLDRALKGAGDAVIEWARGPLGVGKEDWFNEGGGSITIGDYSRETRRVGNNHPAAAAREFGSGHRVGGRPQGGSNEPTRALGKAGSRIGDFHGNGRH